MAAPASPGHRPMVQVGASRYGASHMSRLPHLVDRLVIRRLVALVVASRRRSPASLVGLAHGRTESRCRWPSPSPARRGADRRPDPPTRARRADAAAVPRRRRPPTTARRPAPAGPGPRPAAAVPRARRAPRPTLIADARRPARPAARDVRDPGCLRRDRLRRRLGLARGRRAWPTSRPVAPSRPTPRSRWRASRRRSRPALILRSRRGRPAVASTRPAKSYLPGLADRSRDHRPPAARPHQRPARLLSSARASTRPCSARRGAGVGPGAIARLRRQAVLQARAVDGTTRTRTTSSSGWSPRPSGGAPVADQLRERFFEPLRARPHLVPGGRARRGAARSRTAIGSSARSPKLPGDRPVGRLARRAVHLGRHRVRRGRLDRQLERRRSRAAGPRPSTAATLLDDGHARAMVADIARTARLKPAIPYGLGVQAITVDGQPTLGHSGRFLGCARGRALAARASGSPSRS